MKAIFTLLISLLMASGIARAGQSYFVSPAGDDIHDGRTEATAWRSMSKVNVTMFAPGDVVSFQRGGVWHEPLKPTQGGAVGSPLIFTAYGQGERPLLVGSDEVPAAGNRIPLAAPVHAVLLDDAFLRTPADYHVEKDVLILSKPVSPGQKLRLIRRDDMVHLSHVDHVVVRELAVDAGKRNLLKGCTITLAETVKPFNAAISLVAPDSGLRWDGCTIGAHGAAIRTWFPDVKAANCQARGNKYPAPSTFMIKGKEKPLTLTDWQALGFDFAE